MFLFLVISFEDKLQCYTVYVNFKTPYQLEIIHMYYQLHKKKTLNFKIGSNFIFKWKINIHGDEGLCINKFTSRIFKTNSGLVWIDFTIYN